MKWITHQVGGVLAASILIPGIPGIAGALAGAIAPDWLDRLGCALGRTPRQRQKIFNNIHRGTTHWPVWWVALFCATLALPLDPVPLALASGFALGGITHVALDMLTPQGVPIRPFSRRGKVAAPLCTTGKWGEYVFLAALIAWGCWFWAGELASFLGRASEFFHSPIFQ